MDSATLSEGENVPEIQSLAGQVERLSSAVNFWNQAMLWGLGAAALAAVFIVITTRLAITRAGQLSTAQALLSAEKERQLQLQLAFSNKATEDERSERLKLEAQIAPRRLTQQQKAKIAANCTHFKNGFAGKRVKVVSYSLDTEGVVFSEQIVSSLRASGMVVDDDSMSVMPVGTLIMGISVFGSDSELAKDIANAIGSSGSPIAVSFSETDPTAGAIKFEYGESAPQATILVGVKPPDKDTVDELVRTMPHK
jgi:hypothetical protein